jgi:shikimate kinase
MSGTMQNKRIILWGMMGSGKSYWGEWLANELKLPFIDLDLHIEAEARETISKIFADRGEAAFRSMEQKLLKEVLKEDFFVLAVGGGCPVDESNRSAMLESALCAFLDWPEEKILRRLSDEEIEKRPLLQYPDWPQRWQQLYLERLPLYSEAQLRWRNERDITGFVQVAKTKD